MTKNIFSDESLRDWLETQDPSDEYDYEESRGCILYRYCKAILPETVYMTSATVATGVTSADGWTTYHHIPLPPHWNSISKREPWTVGHVLDRLEQLEEALVPPVNWRSKLEGLLP